MRATEQAYIKGLTQGYALAKAQYLEVIRDALDSEMHNDQPEDTDNELT